MEKKLIWLSDGPGLTTGYSMISRKLLNYLADKGWDCHFLDHVNSNQTFKPGVKLEDNEEFKFHVHGRGLQPYCLDLIMPKIQELKPKVFGILLDTFMVYPHLLNIDFSPAKSVFYFPSDGGGGMPLGCENILRKIDCPVAMSMYAQKQVKEMYNINCEYIPHAVEPEVYKPLTPEGKMQARVNWSNKLGVDLRNKFIVGSVARNQGRKMLDRTLKAFARVCKDMPDAILLLHTDKNDPAGYFNFDDMINKLKIQNRVIFTGTKYFRGVDYKGMNEIYNLMDIFFLGTSGEGFGIPTIEAMSCAIPVLVTDYTTTWEIVTRNKSGEAIKISDELLGNWNVERAIMDIKDAGDKILKLYKDPLLRKEYGLNGRTAVLRDYNWQTVADQWDKLLTKLAT